MFTRASDNHSMNRVYEINEYREFVAKTFRSVIGVLWKRNICQHVFVFLRRVKGTERITRFFERCLYVLGLCLFELHSLKC